MTRGTRLVILCEDRQQEVFARHYFMERGFHRREITSKVSPAGKGAGEQYVRKRYPKEVSAYRSRSSYQSVCLVVVIDADKFSVQRRLKQLDQRLADEGQARRGTQEQIAIFVPRRNIETWIHYLRGDSVDDASSYPKLEREGDCRPDVKRLATEVCPHGPPADSPASLRQACDELSRIV